MCIVLVIPMLTKHAKFAKSQGVAIILVLVGAYAVHLLDPFAKLFQKILVDSMTGRGTNETNETLFFRNLDFGAAMLLRYCPESC